MSATAMIWGASGGIGRALVDRLKDEGWTVVAISRHPEELEAHADCAIAADPADSFQVEQAVMRAAQEVGEVDLWIYTAGDIMARPVAELTPSAWQQIMDANLTGAFVTTHHSLPLLAEDAHLIFLGAYHERLQAPGLAAYAAAKAGLQAFTTTLGKEQRKRRVTLVRPAAVDTPLWDKVPLRLPKQALTPGDVAAQLLQHHAAGKNGSLDL